MLKFEKLVEERKALANRLEALTGLRSVYTRAPLYAYEIGVYTVDRDGNLLVDEADADQNILVTLLNEGFIAMPDIAVTNCLDDSVCNPLGDVFEEDNTEEAAIQDDGAASNADPTQADSTVQNDDPAQASYTSHNENTAQNEDATSAAVDEEESVNDASGISLDMDFELPITDHTGVSLRNLVFLIYSRGPAINKATGASFHVDRELVEMLRDDRCTYTVANFCKALTDYTAMYGSGMEGLVIAEDRISFTGFAVAPDLEHLTAYGHLAVLMNRMAITQKRIQAKEINAENEKYAFRIWLLRLGMNGDAFKLTRKLLMEKLEGHIAFKTLDDAERAKVRALQRREALKATQAEATTLETIPA